MRHLLSKEAEAAESFWADVVKLCETEIEMFYRVVMPFDSIFATWEMENV